MDDRAKKDRPENGRFEMIVDFPQTLAIHFLRLSVLKDGHPFSVLCISETPWTVRFDP